MANLLNKEIDLLRQNARSMVRELGLLNDAYFEIGVTLAERHLLIELASCSHSTTGKKIAESLLLDKSTASRLIAKAEKKGYVKYSSNDKDKRQKFLSLTEFGKTTLAAFEPVAFNQTKEALLALTPDEVEFVCKGVALYASGLKRSRLKNKASDVTKENVDTQENDVLYPDRLTKIHGELDRRGLTLEPFDQNDEEALYHLFKEVVDAGNQFPFECNSVQEFYRRFLETKSHIYVCKSTDKEVVGGFYIKSNFPGRARHIANAGYMVKSSERGKGIGKLLVKASLEISRSFGFKAMQFNLVLSQNAVAVELYKKLGFTVIGTIPQAIRNADGSYQDGYIMYYPFPESLSINKID